VRAIPLPIHSRRRTAGLAAVTAAAGLALVPAASADVLVSRSDDGDGTARPVLIAPDGARRELAPAATNDQGQNPVVSPDRRFVAVAGAEKVAVLPTDGSPALPIAPDTGVAVGGNAFWWAPGPLRLIAATGALGNRGDVATCPTPSGPCPTRRAPGETLIGALDTGASVWQRSTAYLPPEGLNGAFEEWVAASPSKLRAVRAGLRRRAPQRLILRAADGTQRTVSSGRRSPASGVDSYTGLTGAGARVIAYRSTTRTTVRTRTRNGRRQLRLVDSVTVPKLRVFSVTGRSKPFRLRAPAGTRPQEQDGLIAVPGGWLIALQGTDGASTRTLGRVSPTGEITTIASAGAPLTAKTLRAALGLPAPEPGPRGIDVSGLRPIGYEAATDSDVVAVDEPGDSRQVFARVPRNGSAPSLVLRGDANVRLDAIAW
jgi:hypothetical protein